MEEVSQDWGVVHKNEDPNVIGGGCALFDFDNDGFDDLYLIGGSLPDRLFRNIGGKNFQEVIPFTNLNFSNYQTLGVVSGDIDNDGFEDLFITTDSSTPNLLLVNDGQGFFISSNGIPDGNMRSVSAAMADVNLDGWLDIYIANYIEFEDRLFFEGLNSGQKNQLLLNNGDNTFSDLTDKYHVADSGASLATMFSDVDQDGDQDLFVINDFGPRFQPNALYVNNYPIDSFSVLMDTVSPVSVRIDGMGISQSDLNEDGLFDYYISNIGENLLVLNGGDLNFSEVSNEWGLELDSDISWSSTFEDFDNDSYEDLFVANGEHIGNNVANSKSQNRFFLNDSNRHFIDITQQALGFRQMRSRGSASGDINNDGRIDLVVTKVENNTIDDRDEPAFIYINETSNSGNFIKFYLQGVQSNRNAAGTKVSIYLKDRIKTKAMTLGSGYVSKNSSVIHFGLGSFERIDSIRINWPSGILQTFKEIETNENYFIRENDPLRSIEFNFLEPCSGQVIEINSLNISRDTVLTIESSEVVEKISIQYKDCNSNPLSLDDPDHKIFNVFPNPTDSYVKVSIVGPATKQDLKVTIIDLSGKTFMESPIFLNQLTIDISHFPDGIYLMTVHGSDGFRTSERFVKK